MRLCTSIVAVVLVTALALAPAAWGQTTSAPANAVLLTNQQNNASGGAVGVRRPGRIIQQAIAAHVNPGALAGGAEADPPDVLDTFLGTLFGGTSSDNLLGLLTGQGGEVDFQKNILLAAIDIFFNEILEPCLQDFLAGLGAASPPLAATTPTPIDGATNVAATTSLSWRNGGGATSFDVYLAIDDALTTDDRQSVNQTGTSFTPAAGTLDAGIEYFWRIDSKNAAGTTRGTVWSFIVAP
jgi:hypothetical protein